MPTVSAPPGRLSTTTDCPSCLESAGASRRAKLSVALPAACGTTRRTGWAGYCARATGGATSATTSAASEKKKEGAGHARHGTPSFLGSDLRLELAADLAAL